MTERKRDGALEVEGDAAVEDLAHLLARFATLRRAVAWDAAAFELPDLHEATQLVQRHQPVDPPGTPATQAALDRLLDWAARQGVRVADGLRLVATPDGTQVLATTAITAGDPLIAVPVEAMVRTSTVLARDPTIGSWLGDQPLFGPGTLMLWLVIERHGDRDGTGMDLWSDYVAALPGAVPGTALSWPRSPGSHLLAADMGRRFLAGVLQLYCVVYRRLVLTDPDQRPITLEAFTLQRWLWAGAILASRQTEIAGELALVPVWDLLAHDESLGAETSSFEHGALRCLAAVDLQPGDLAAMYYGRRTPTERWVYAGFVPPGPPDGDRPLLPFPVPLAAPLRREKLLWVISDRDRPIGVRVGRGELDAALARARWYALDHDELERLGLSSVADAWDQPLVLSEPVEARAQALLRDWLAEVAGPSTPDQPFSREHAFVLAAAHARYAGLVPNPDGVRLLDDSDAARVDEFLASQLAAPLMLRANLHRAGLTCSGIRHSGTWVGVFAGEALTGVAMHARNGYLIMHTVVGNAEVLALARHTQTCSGRPIAGLLGGWAEVDAVRHGLGLGERRLIQDGRYDVHSMELASLAKLEPPADGLVLRCCDAGATWWVELGGEQVSTATLTPSPTLGVVEVTDVSTVEPMRGRGYARWCLASALASARDSGCSRALLLVEADNVAARTSYAALGFHRVGDHAILRFDTEAAC